MSVSPTVMSPRSSGKIVTKKNVSWVWSSGRTDFVQNEEGDDEELMIPATDTATTKQSCNDDSFSSSSSSIDLSFRSILNDDDETTRRDSDVIRRARRRVEKSSNLSSPISGQQKRITANKLIVNKSLYSNLRDSVR